MQHMMITPQMDTVQNLHTPKSGTTKTASLLAETEVPFARYPRAFANKGPQTKVHNVRSR